MNLRDLEYLVALDEEKHFRKAAERCFVSQPTLSGQLRKLEDELGVILIERTSRKVLFTPAGDAMAHQARRVLKEVRELKSIGQHFSEPMSGEIHIGFIPTVGPYLLPRIIQTLRERFPQLEFYLYEEQTQTLLKRLEDDLRERALSPASEVPELRTQLQAEWQAARDAERTAETFESWAEQVITQAGVHWLLNCVFLRFIEAPRVLRRPAGLSQASTAEA